VSRISFITSCAYEGALSLRRLASMCRRRVAGSGDDSIEIWQAISPGSRESPASHSP
jgi:hypothetical protein